MRLLVACPKCKRQYDASQLPIGGHFRCHCGTVLTIKEPKSHDAAAVCCAQCGAPRSPGAAACEHCGAEFTLHERDLDTVCPHCFTRVSRKARFCHYCGTHIHPEMVAGQATELVCPECGIGHTLTSRAWGDVSVAECQQCAGLWLANDTFRHLTDQATADGVNADARGSPPKTRPPEAESRKPDTGVKYRRCAVCGQQMVKQNYGRRSGVIVDWCKYDGVWFDADELPRILDWVRAGGLGRANREQSAEEEKAESLRRRRGPVARGGGLGDSQGDVVQASIFEILLQGVSHFFFR